MNKRAQPEVFETSESETPAVKVPDDAKKQDKQPVDKKTSEDLLESCIRPALAFEKFAGKVFDAGPAGALGEGVQPYVFRVGQPTEYTAFPSSQRAFESPLERYHRLKTELSQFHDELQTLSKSASDAKDPVSRVSSLITTELKKMEQDLQGIVANPQYGVFLKQSFPGETHKDLLSRVLDATAKSAAEQKAAGAAVAPPGPAGAAGAENITYELYLNPQKDKVVRQQVALTELDQRLTQVERTLGSVKEEKAPSFPDVHSGLHYLQRQLALLDQNKLDAVYRRVRSLMSELEQLENAKNKVQSVQVSEHQDKVNVLFNLMSKWDAAAEQLPAVVARLQSLRDVHEEAASAVLKLQSIESQSHQVSTLLTQDKDALQKVESTLAANMKIVQTNLNSLQARMEALSKKMEKIK